jgi:hypothetical protein
VATVRRKGGVPDERAAIQPAHTAAPHSAELPVAVKGDDRGRRLRRPDHEVGRRCDPGQQQEDRDQHQRESERAVADEPEGTSVAAPDAADHVVPIAAQRLVERHEPI